MAVEELPIFAFYDRQRFVQFSPQDCANWYIMQAESGKKKQALYPCMGRKHINFLNQNRLIFANEPDYIFRSINFAYVVVGTSLYQVDRNLNYRLLSNPDFNVPPAQLNFAYLPVVQTPMTGNIQTVFCGLCDGKNTYIIDETPGVAVPFTTVTDALAPANPLYIAAFGNRFVVSSRNSTQFQLTQINLGGVYDPTKVFTIPGSNAVFAQEAGIIRQFAVLHNQLYMFTDFTTGIWSNNPSVFTSASTTTTFPWKKNTSYDWDYGMADPNSLDVDFGRMVWLAQNRDGLVQFMTSQGQTPESISTPAVNVILQNSAMQQGLSPYLSGNTDGFLYSYEDSIFYRVSAGRFLTFGILDLENSTNCLEFSFDSGTWHRCIEINGERNLIQKHIFFANKHLVTVEGESAIYEMAGNFYVNELRNPLVVDPQSPLAFVADPFRYELITSIIAQNDYSEFITHWVQIDFVWGIQTPVQSGAPFDNTVFIIGEGSTPDNPIYLVTEDGNNYIIAEGSNYPDLNDDTYNALYKPHIELYWSDDAGISFHSADVLQFSDLGIYSWRMRWYQLGVSRNRVYKLICVSPSPIVVLGAIMNVERISGGAS